MLHSLKMAIFILLVTILFQINIISSSKNKTINIIRLTSTFMWDYAIDYAISIVNSRTDVLPNHQVKLYGNNIGPVRFH